MGRIDESILTYEQAIQIDLNNADLYNDLGILFKNKSELNQSLNNFDLAIKLRPNFAEAHKNKGNVLHELGFLHESQLSYKAALKLNANYKLLLGTYLHTKMQLCLWDDITNDLINYKSKIIQNENVSKPFDGLSLIDDPLLHKSIAETYIKELYPANSTLGPIISNEICNKLTIAYFSADFNEHAVSFLLVELFELHNKEKFNLIGFSTTILSSNATTDRIFNSFDQLIEVSRKSDVEVASMARSLNVDIAIDLGGHTGNNRFGIFAHRAAPIQISYLGYLGTTGAEYMDYIVSDPILIPSSSQVFYTEKIIYLPHYQANDTKRDDLGRIYKRSDFGLPEDAFIFCCFNNNYKFSPDVFDSWMNILKSSPNSIIFLYAKNEQIKSNLVKEAQIRSVNTERIYFGGHVNRAEYMGRLSVCDLFLDTFTYNAGTTASDALWASLPVLTCMGESFASRMCSSILTSINLPELITNNQNDYENKAIDFANNPEKLVAIKNKLITNKSTAPLFNCEILTRNLEQGYLDAFKSFADGAPISHIYVSHYCIYSRKIIHENVHARNI
jgi:predicted O-linked N-acetylglucosamine transferase (SPINDLY family)